VGGADEHLSGPHRLKGARLSDLSEDRIDNLYS